MSFDAIKNDHLEGVKIGDLVRVVYPRGTIMIEGEICVAASEPYSRDCISDSPFINLINSKGRGYRGVLAYRCEKVKEGEQHD